MNLDKKLVLSTLAIFTSVFVLGGCTSTPNDALTSSEIERLVNSPKIAAYPSPDELDFVFTSGISKQYIIGTVKQLKSAKKSCFKDTDCFEWVPVQIDVDGSMPEIPAGVVTVRLFPSSEQTPDLRDIQVGDRVLAATSAKFTDDNKIQGYSLGWLFKVEADGSMKNLDRNSTIVTSLTEVNSLLKTSFK
jgi:hypothetical protein